MSNLTTATKYFGCQIEVNGEIHTMWGIVPDGVWYTEKRTNRVAKWGEWKPILKPLSEITDEDAVEVAKIEDIPQAMRFELFGCDHENLYTIGRYIKEQLISCQKHEDFVVRWQVADFLRSRYYDIDNVLNK